MPNSFGPENIVWVIAILFVLAIAVILWYTMRVTPGSICPTELHRSRSGKLTLKPSGQEFEDMNEFQQYWHSSGLNRHCPIPVLEGATKEVPVLEQDSRDEQTYAKTPIYKVDDYEFSRIVGYERDGHMKIPRDDYNMILNNRTFDWADKPMSSDERKGKYRGLREGFAANGELGTVDPAIEAVQRYGEKKDEKNQDDDIDCKVSREAKEVAAMVAKAYDNDPNFEPVVTKVGAHQWEVTELKPKRRNEKYSDPVEERVVDTADDSVDVEFKYREKQIVDDAIDPYFTGIGDVPWQSDRYAKDPFYGPVPGMERMFGPTFDHKDWY